MNRKFGVLGGCPLYICLFFLAFFSFFITPSLSKAQKGAGGGGGGGKNKNNAGGVSTVYAVQKDKTDISSLYVNDVKEKKEKEKEGIKKNNIYLQEFNEKNKYSSMQNSNKYSDGAYNFEEDEDDDIYTSEMCTNMLTEIKKICTKIRTEKHKVQCESDGGGANTKNEKIKFTQTSEKDGMCSREVSRREPYSCTKKEERQECKEQNVEVMDLCERIKVIEEPSSCHRTVIQEVCDTDLLSSTTNMHRSSTCFEKAKQIENYSCKKLAFREECSRKYSCENKVKKQKCETITRTYNSTCVEDVYDEEYTCDKLHLEEECPDSPSPSTEIHVMAVRSLPHNREERNNKKKNNNNNMHNNNNNNNINNNNNHVNTINDKPVMIKLPCKQVLKTVQSVCTRPSKTPRKKEYECEKSEEIIECNEVEEYAKDICYESIKKEDIPKRYDKNQYVCNKIQIEEESVCTREVEVAAVHACGQSNAKKNCKEIKKVVEEECIKKKEVSEKYECKKQKKIHTCTDMTPVLRNEICYKIIHIVEEYVCDENQAFMNNAKKIYNGNDENSNACFRDIVVEYEDNECIQTQTKKFIKKCSARFSRRLEEEKEKEERKEKEKTNIWKKEKERRKNNYLMETESQGEKEAKIMNKADEEYKITKIITKKNYENNNKENAERENTKGIVRIINNENKIVNKINNNINSTLTSVHRIVRLLNIKKNNSKNNNKSNNNDNDIDHGKERIRAYSSSTAQKGYMDTFNNFDYSVTLHDILKRI